MIYIQIKTLNCEVNVLKRNRAVTLRKKIASIK